MVVSGGSPLERPSSSSRLIVVDDGSQLAAFQAFATPPTPLRPTGPNAPLYNPRHTRRPPHSCAKEQEAFAMKLLLLCTVAVVACCVCAHEDCCLKGRSHKPEPGPEPDMHACQIYKSKACCTAAFTTQLEPTTISRVEDTYWNLCGNLSTKCQAFMKRNECFYRCSPHAADWMNPSYKSGLLHVPICSSYCSDWYEACRSDLTCARNWMENFSWNVTNSCRNSCIPFSEMYSNSTDLCESMWGVSYQVAPEGKPCLYIGNETSPDVEGALAHENSGENSSADKTESSEEHKQLARELKHKHPNRRHYPNCRKAKSKESKESAEKEKEPKRSRRSLQSTLQFMEELEGSSSGIPDSPVE
ncbi:uncharacterized protein LOC116948961 [Petromyzon marinus]|uniref:uncharacterized protein LOC116948961 n=1 Tax=Petromyzon marinus TaxID=7757 RepID=UPI003F701FCA